MTLHEVAARAGVSVRTVSNVVNDYLHVAPTTRERVQTAIAELGYRPNRAARALRRPRTVTVSLVVPELDSPYFAEIAALLVRAAEARGWAVQISQSDGDRERERAMLAGTHGQGADAVVFSPWALGAGELSRGPAAPPVAMLGERSGVGLVDHVAVDSVAAADEAASHVIALGARRVAVVGLQPHLANETARQRLEGTHRALRRAGLTPEPDLEVAVDRLHRADGARATAGLLEAANPFDALVCFSDQLALGALHTLAAAGVRVPEDVAVVGFDDIEDGRYAVPSLTTIAPDKPGLVETTLDCLADRLADPALPARDLIVGHQLIARESTVGTSAE